MRNKGEVDPGLSVEQLESAARGCITKFSDRERFLAHLLELLISPVVRGVDWIASGQGKSGLEPKNILVVECGQIGDAVLVQPCLQNLRFHYPHARIVLAGNPKVAPILDRSPLIDEFLPVRAPWIVGSSMWQKYGLLNPLGIRFVKSVLEMRSRKFDLALCARADVREAFLLWLINARRRIGYGFYGGKTFLTDVAVPDPWHPHYSDRWLHMIEALGKPMMNHRVRMSLDADNEDSATRYLVDHGVRDNEMLIGIHPGARVPTRQWGHGKFRETGQRLSSKRRVRVLWFEDPSVKQQESDNNNETDSFLRVRVPLREFMSLLSRCKLLICNDSGPMHIAGSLGIPVVAIFGPNNPSWFGPLGDTDRIIMHPGFWCRPCGDQCIFDQPYCLRVISVDQVCEAVTRFLDTSDNSPHEN